MKRFVVGFGRFWWDFIVGDDWKIAAGVAFALGIGAVLVSETDLSDGVVSVLQEQGHGPGPFGAKSLGEGCMLPVASAIANAVEDATGARVTALPLTPERVLAALDRAGKAAKRG